MEQKRIPKAIMSSNLQIAVVMLIALVVTAVSGCERKAPPTSSGPASAIPFKGEIYRTLDGASAITITSPEELEMTEGGVNLICKYTKPDENTLRVVVTSFGTTQAVYFQITPQGLRSNTGAILLEPSTFAKAQEQLQQARAEAAAREQALRLKEEQERRTKAEAEMHRKIELQKAHLAIRDSAVIAMKQFFQKGSVIKALYHPGFGDIPFEVELTGEPEFAPRKNDPYDQDFTIAGHAKWTAGKDLSLNSSGRRGTDDGMFFGRIIIDRRSESEEGKLYIEASFRLPDGNFGGQYVNTGFSDGQWDGNKFKELGGAGMSIRFWK